MKDADSIRFTPRKSPRELEYSSSGRVLPTSDAADEKDTFQDALATLIIRDCNNQAVSHEQVGVVQRCARSRSCKAGSCLLVLAVALAGYVMKTRHHMLVGTSSVEDNEIKAEQAIMVNIPTSGICCSKCQADVRCTDWDWTVTGECILQIDDTPRSSFISIPCNRAEDHWAPPHDPRAREDVYIHHSPTAHSHQEIFHPTTQDPVAPEKDDALAVDASPDRTTRLHASDKSHTLYCFALILPWGYERYLLASHRKLAAGIFGCDGHSVFSNKSIHVAPDTETIPIESNLKCDYGGEFNTVLNLDVFVVVWEKVMEVGTFSKFDWTVKVDADTVFFPDRLRNHLELQEHWLQEPRGVYMVNCKFGLHGPIEVFSKKSVITWMQFRSRCREHFNRLCSGDCHWGEDMFVDQCLDKVAKSKRVKDFKLIAEDHCDPPKGWAECNSGSFVGFHPFKNVSSWRKCWDNSRSVAPVPPTSTSTHTRSTTITTTSHSTASTSQRRDEHTTNGRQEIPAIDRQSTSRYEKVDGYITRGGDILNEVMSVEKAEDTCQTLAGCVGFTLDEQRWKGTPERPTVYFKSKWDVIGAGMGWASYRLIRAQRETATESHEDDSSNVGGASRPYGERQDDVSRPYLEEQAYSRDNSQAPFTRQSRPTYPREEAIQRPAAEFQAETGFPPRPQSERWQQPHAQTIGGQDQDMDYYQPRTDEEDNYFPLTGDPRQPQMQRSGQNGYNQEWHAHRMSGARYDDRVNGWISDDQTGTADNRWVAPSSPWTR